ncbi:MAG TPA: hypothetical protein VM754_08005 [Actinomycetota bacterium]|nr:hypothetical protein [Actinomycetota bacterium]
MTLIQVALAIPAGFFVWTLVRDFFAGLGEDRLWGDPEIEETAIPSSGREWETLSAKVYDYRPPRQSAGGLAQLPLDSEA